MPLAKKLAGARRHARGRRGVHGCRAGRCEPRRRGRARQHRRAALVRQIFRSCRTAARLCARGAGARARASRRCSGRGRFRAGAGRRRASAGGSGLDRNDARAARAKRRAARCDPDRSRSRHCRRHDVVPAGAHAARRANCSIISAAPEFWCACFPTMPEWLRFGLPARGAGLAAVAKCDGRVRQQQARLAPMSARTHPANRRCRRRRRAIDELRRCVPRALARSSGLAPRRPALPARSVAGRRVGIAHRTCLSRAVGRA